MKAKQPRQRRMFRKAKPRPKQPRATGPARDQRRRAVEHDRAAGLAIPF